jgi:hypothetical protein
MQPDGKEQACTWQTVLTRTCRILSACSRSVQPTKKNCHAMAATVLSIKLGAKIGNFGNNFPFEDDSSSHSSHIHEIGIRDHYHCAVTLY